MSVCRVGANMSAVSSESFPTKCVCSLPGLLTGCYALALVDTWHTTVDCLLPASSATMLWDLRSWLRSPLVIHPLFAWQQGSVTYILSWAFQLALVGLRCLRVPSPGLLFGYYALALLVQCRTAVDCLVLASSAATLWVHGDWHIVHGYTPSVCLATGIVNLYTVMGLPASPGGTAVPQGFSVLQGSGSSRWGRPFESSLHTFVRTRS